jgi:hypothetical protein
MEDAEQIQPDNGVRERPEYLPAKRKKEGAGIAWTLIIGLALAAALAGGVKIYVDTVAGWQRNKEAKERSVSNQRAAGDSAVREMDAQRNAYNERVQSAIDAQLKAEEQELRRGNLRCINGALFRRLPNGWENIPGRPC